jgi:hypothetical protein
MLPCYPTLSSLANLLAGRRVFPKGRRVSPATGEQIQYCGMTDVELH